MFSDAGLAVAAPADNFKISFAKYEYLDIKVIFRDIFSISLSTNLSDSKYNIWLHFYTPFIKLNFLRTKRPLRRHGYIVRKKYNKCKYDLHNIKILKH